MDTVENSIFTGLINNENYTRKVIPHLKQEYFADIIHKKIFETYKKYYLKYNSAPSTQALTIEITKAPGLNDEETLNAVNLIKSFNVLDDKDYEWLVDATEQFCKDRAIYLAISEGIDIINDNDQENGSIPKILTDALSVSFDEYIGHDFLENSNERHDFYTKTEVKIPFDIDLLNTITDGGLCKKTLNVIMSGVNVGKTLMMCHLAAANLIEGLNVLYITLEMAEEKIAERIDANLLNVKMDELKMIPSDAFEKKIDRVKNKTSGKLIIKEYPTSSAHVGHFRHLLNELKIKKQFIPDIIYVDYLNICASSRVKQTDLYSYVKCISEELRGLAVEFNLPIVTATQVNRDGFTNSDFGMENTSESWGLPQTVDLMLGVFTSEELKELDQISIKQLKNRYSNPNKIPRFIVGIDYDHMRLYDVEQLAQEDITENKANNVFNGFK